MGIFVNLSCLVVRGLVESAADVVGVGGGGNSPADAVAQFLTSRFADHSQRHRVELDGWNRAAEIRSGDGDLVRYQVSGRTVYDDLAGSRSIQAHWSAC